LPNLIWKWSNLAALRKLMGAPPQTILQLWGPRSGGGAKKISNIRVPPYLLGSSPKSIPGHLHTDHSNFFCGLRPQSQGGPLPFFGRLRRSEVTYTPTTQIFFAAFGRNHRGDPYLSPLVTGMPNREPNP